MKGVIYHLFWSHKIDNLADYQLPVDRSDINLDKFFKQKVF